MELGDTVLQYAQEFFSQVGITAEVQVDFDETNNLYLITLSCEDPAVVIGYHGETLSSLQLILGQHLKAKTGEWLNISLNVNDYRERREKSLHTMADSVISQVIATGKAHTLPPMPANERRIVHMYISENPQVISESTGEGRTRSVVISLKS